MKWILRAALGVSLVMVLGHGPALAQGAGGQVSWLPGAVTAEVTAGGTGFVEVELSAETALIGALLDVSPSLRSFAGAAPLDLGNFAAGESRTVTLGFGTLWDDMPSVAFTVTGTLRVLAGSGGVAVAQELPVTLTVVPLPPDPGEAGKATLEGIDSDTDGLRDDIQRYIAFTFANSPSVRAAAAAYAKKVQETFFIGEDRVRAVNLAAEIDSTARCIAAMHGSDTFESLQAAHDAENELRTVILNTVDRSRAYLSFDALLAGGIFVGTPESTWASQCSFDPSSLPN